jgi:hypothetical protein
MTLLTALTSRAGFEPCGACGIAPLRFAFNPYNIPLLRSYSVIRGTRITAQTVLEFLGAGDSIEDVLQEYPSLAREDILACIQYSSRLMSNRFSLEMLA